MAEEIYGGAAWPMAVELGVTGAGADGLPAAAS